MATDAAEDVETNRRVLSNGVPHFVPQQQAAAAGTPRRLGQVPGTTRIQASTVTDGNQVMEQPAAARATVHAPALTDRGSLQF